MVPFCTPFNGGSFILLKAKCCSHRFLQGNHIHLTLVHLEEETLSVSPPVSPLARMVRVKSVCHGACYCFWQPSLNSGRPCQRLKDLKSFRYDFTSRFGCSRSRKRKAKDSHSPCVGKLVPFNMAFLLFTAAPLWPETQAGESDEGFKRGRRETQLWIIARTQCHQCSCSQYFDAITDIWIFFSAYIIFSQSYLFTVSFQPPPVSIFLYPTIFHQVALSCPALVFVLVSI